MASQILLNRPDAHLERRGSSESRLGEGLWGLKRLSDPGAQALQRLFQMGGVQRKSSFPTFLPPTSGTNKRPAQNR